MSAKKKKVAAKKKKAAPLRNPPESLRVSRKKWSGERTASFSMILRNPPITLTKGKTKSTGNNK